MFATILPRIQYYNIMMTRRSGEGRVFTRRVETPPRPKIPWHTNNSIFEAILLYSTIILLSPMEVGVIDHQGFQRGGGSHILSFIRPFPRLYPIFERNAIGDFWYVVILGTNTHTIIYW